MKYILFFWSLILFFALISCHDMNSTYVEYIEGGEIVYASKPDSLKIYPGKNRIKLSWIPRIDKKATRAKIYWNNGEDSMEYRIDKTSHNGTVDVIIPDLPEGTYSFDVYVLDAKGNRSIKSVVEGNVYGDRFKKFLLNRPIKHSFYKEIVWLENSNEEMVSVELIYKDQNDKSHTIFIDSAENKTFIPHYQYYSEIKYKTGFVPEGTSIDTFYTDFETVKLENILNPSHFSRWNNQYFPYKQDAIYQIERMWDGKTNADFGYVWAAPNKPESITFDMGQLAKLKTGRIVPNYNASFLYHYGHVKKMQIWGKEDTTGTTDLETWEYLGEFISFRPSGLPDSNAPTTEDIAYASKGEYFDFNPDAPPVRYIRLVIQEVYGDVAVYKPKINITELTFWGDNL